MGKMLIMTINTDMFFSCLLRLVMLLMIVEVVEGC